MTLTRLSPLTTLALAAMTGACSPAPGERTAEDPARERLLKTVEAEASPNPGENCLLMVWSEQDDPDVEFDRAHDAVKGGAISCATGASPSQFEAAISALRDRGQGRQAGEGHRNWAG